MQPRAGMPYGHDARRRAQVAAQAALRKNAAPTEPLPRWLTPPPRGPGRDGSRREEHHHDDAGKAGNVRHGKHRPQHNSACHRS